MENKKEIVTGIVGIVAVVGTGIAGTICTMGACSAVNQVCEDNGVPRWKRWGTVLLTYFGGLAVTAQVQTGIADLTVNSMNKTKK